MDILMKKCVKLLSKGSHIHLEWHEEQENFLGELYNLIIVLL